MRAREREREREGILATHFVSFASRARDTRTRVRIFYKDRNERRFIEIEFRQLGMILKNRLRINAKRLNRDLVVDCHSDKERDRACLLDRAPRSASETIPRKRQSFFSEIARTSIPRAFRESSSRSRDIEQLTDSSKFFAKPQRTPRSRCKRKRNRNRSLEQAVGKCQLFDSGTSDLDAIGDS